MSGFALQARFRRACKDVRRWLGALGALGALGLACMVGAALAAPLLADPEVRDALARGQPQAVIVQLVDTPARAETDNQRRGRRNAAKGRVRQALNPAHFDNQREYSELPMLALKLRHPDALARLLAHPDVKAVHADVPIKLFADASLTLVNQPPVQTVMQRTGAGQTIAVIDSGVDYTQAAFGSCSAPGVGSGCKVVASYYTATNSATPPAGDTLDTIGHGTKVSTVALSVAPGARIAALGVFTGGASNSSDVIEAINWTIANRAAYNIVGINLSLGDSINHTDTCAGNVLATPVNSARNAGMAVVAATGNDAFTSGIAAPACVSAAVAVGAVYSANWGGLAWSGCTDASTAADQITCFSNSGAQLDLLAPGALFSFNGSNSGGTSFASPMVAGAVAVLKAQFPGETVSQIEARLLNNGALLTDPRNGVARRRLDLLAAQGAPVNDNFASRITLAGNSVTTTGWNYNATLQSGEPTLANAAAGSSVWWSWTPATSGRLTLNATGSAVPATVAAYTGNAVAALVNVQGGFGSIGVDVNAGTPYAIQLAGQNGAQGALSLALNWSAASADLSVALNHPGTVTAGQQVSLTATVTNSGPSPAAGATVTFTLPAGWQFVSGSGCTASGQAVSCSLGTLAVGSVDINITVNVTVSGAPTIQVAASSSTTEPVSAINTVSASNAVHAAVPLPPLALWALGAALMLAVRRQSTTRRPA